MAAAFAGRCSWTHSLFTAVLFYFCCILVLPVLFDTSRSTVLFYLSCFTCMLLLVWAALKEVCVLYGLYTSAGAHAACRSACAFGAVGGKDFCLHRFLWCSRL